MGDKDFDNFNLQIGEIIGMTLDGKAIYKFTELGTAENVMFGESIFKDGDFVVNEAGSILIFKEKVGDCIYDHAFLIETGGVYFINGPSITQIERHATEEEKQKMLDALAKKGKRWNAEKKCIEDIPKRKFKAGDKVKIKDGISSETHRHIFPHFTELMDEFIGKELTVKEYNDGGWVVFYEDDREYNFAEDWLEPYEKLKEGDLAIFWDHDKEFAIIKRYYRLNNGVEYRRHQDIQGLYWDNAIKFESKEQYEKLLKGEI